MHKIKIVPQNHTPKINVSLFRASYMIFSFNKLHTPKTVSYKKRKIQLLSFMHINIFSQKLKHFFFMLINYIIGPFVSIFF